MNRRFAVLSVLALSAGLAAPLFPAAQAASAVPHGQKRVCAVPAKGYAACNAHVVTNAKTAKPLATVNRSGGYIGSQLRAVYPPGGLPGTVAIVDAYAHPNAAADLAAYRSGTGLQALAAGQFTQYNQNGQAAPLAAGDVSWGQEEMLDLEMVSAMCPACNIMYLGANSPSFNDMAAAVTAAKNLGAKVISNSYGGPEFSGESSLQGPYNVPGVAVTVSTGDSGYGAQFPATAEYAIAVGGTSLKLTSANTRSSETVWSGAGSGCSAYIARPSWQTESGCSTHRAEADISAVADPNTGVAVYDSYGSTGGANWYIFGGTSVAAPLVGALYATYGVPTGPSGYAAQDAWVNHGALYDVTSGSNGRCTKGRTPLPSTFCTGSPGWDGPSGNGTPQTDSGSAF